MPPGAGRGKMRPVRTCATTRAFAVTVVAVALAVPLLAQSPSPGPPCRRFPSPWPGETGAARDLARDCYDAEKEKAVEVCRQASRSPLRPSLRLAVYRTLAIRLATLERWGEVTAVWREAAAALPAEPEVHLRLGMALLNVDRAYDEAASELELAIRLRPGDARAHGQLSLVRAAQGRKAEAEAALAEAVRLDPGYLEHRPAAAASRQPSPAP